MAGQVWITNAYDSSNAGDDFLLQSVLERAMIPGERRPSVTVVGNNPDSFRVLGLPTRVTPHYWPSRNWKHVAPRGFANLIGGAGIPSSERPIATIATAGGYTALDRVGGALMYMNDHFATIDLPRRYKVPALMFPVSVGPLHWSVRRRVLAALAAYDAVFVRDDESAEELSTLNNVHRVPDLAVQAIARQAHRYNDSDQQPSGPPTLIGRRLDPQEPTYLTRLHQLSNRLDGIWRPQVARDTELYRRENLKYDERPIDFAGLSAVTPVVVSVRLHGALMSILNGIPAIHLSYDRKGLGAYVDLGITKWLHDASSFDPVDVAEQATDLINSPGEFWSSIDASRSKLLELAAGQDLVVNAFWERLSESDGTS